ATNGFDGGGPGEYTLAQTVTLPSISGNGIIELSWRDSIFWDMATYGAMVPRIFSVEVLDSSDNLLAIVHSKRLEPATLGSTGWILHRASLNTWAGQTVKLMFRHYVPESFTGPANFSIDDIRVETLTTTAGGTVVSGTVESAGGNVLPNISVTLQLADGTIMKSKTNQFGRFSFEGVPAGSNAVISVSSKKHSFSQTSQVRSVTADISDIRFIASN
ncbi:MAG: carboxypeptidase regulatory-like domain-containing protein, partial [Acidobacteriota bacterium]